MMLWLVFWKEIAVGNPLSGQFITRAEGRVDCLKKGRSWGVFLNRTSYCILNGLSLTEINEV